MLAVPHSRHRALDGSASSIIHIEMSQRRKSGQEGERFLTSHHAAVVMQQSRYSECGMSLDAVVLRDSVHFLYYRAHVIESDVNVLISLPSSPSHSSDGRGNLMLHPSSRCLRSHSTSLHCDIELTMAETDSWNNTT